MSQKPTIIFVHGAWHGPECWTKIIAELETKGFKCIAKQWYGGPDAKAGVGTGPVIEQLSATIYNETSLGNNVVIVNHSFGGAIGSSAVKGYSKRDPSKVKKGTEGRVIGIAQVSAFLMPAETSVMDLIGNPDAALHYPTDDGFAKLKPSKDPAEIFYNMCSDEEKVELPKLLKLHPTAMFEVPTGRELIYPGWVDVPMWYLRCTKDNAILVQVQDHMLEQAKQAGADITTRTSETDHSPFYSRPQETVRYIEEAAQAFSS